MRHEILIVDDEESYGCSLQHLFAQEGYRAVTVQSGAEALALLQEGGAELALVDYLLPDIDGVELLARINEQPNPPLCMMLTAYGTIEEAVRAMRVGAFDYVTKSADLGLVLAKATKALEAQRIRRELEGASGIEIVFRPGVDTLDDVNRELLGRALELARGHKGRAAELLGISRFALGRRCEKYGITPPATEEPERG
jgi:DNA-binding NtrC family response regulator